ncbi:hypothetical protein [Streptomyces sp. GQFP]|uniref:hypothetical protein n=1 Tax=Streptomyces sp. GQFP TaxID=2907545 RepID=UPI003FA76415
MVDTRGKPEVIPLYLSRPLVDRALRIMHALLTEADNRGHDVETRTDLGHGEAVHTVAIVIHGLTFPPADLGRIFANQLSVVGSTMGTADQLGRLAAFCVRTGARPVVDRVLPLSEVRAGLAAMASGELFGKVVFTV